jgi:hypothetical protein
MSCRTFKGCYKFKDIFDLDSDLYFSKPLEELTKLGWIENLEDKYTLTRKGLWYAENVSKRFYDKTNINERQPKGKNLSRITTPRFL